MTPFTIAPRTTGKRIKRAVPFALASASGSSGSGRTHGAAWRLFAVFAAAIASVLINAFHCSASMLAVGAIVLTGTSSRSRPTRASPVQRAAGGDRVHRRAGRGRSRAWASASASSWSAASAAHSLGLAYSIVLTDAAIAPAFPSNTARGGVNCRSCSPSPRAGSEPDSGAIPGRLPYVLLDGGSRSPPLCG